MKYYFLISFIVFLYITAYYSYKNSLNDEIYFGVLAICTAVGCMMAYLKEVIIANKPEKSDKFRKMGSGRDIKYIP